MATIDLFFASPSGIEGHIQEQTESPVASWSRLVSELEAAGAVAKTARPGNGQAKAAAEAAIDAAQRQPAATIPFKGTPEPTCPAHGESRASKLPGVQLYCPNKADDGSFCSWQYPPKVRKARAS